MVNPITSLLNREHTVTISEPTPGPRPPHQRPSTRTTISRLLLALITIGISELVKIIRAYRARRGVTPSSPLVQQTQTAQLNLKVLDSLIDPNKLPIFPGVKETVINTLNQFFKGVADYNTISIFIQEALHQLRSTVSSEEKLTSKSLTKLLTEKTKLLILKKLIEEKLLEAFSLEEMTLSESLVRVVMTLLSSEIESIASGPPDDLKSRINRIVKKMLIVAKNQGTKEQAIESCITDGLKGVLGAFYIKPAQVMALPRGPVSAMLNLEASRMEQEIYEQNQGGPVEIPYDVYHLQLMELASSYYGSVIQVGILANQATQNTEETFALLKHAMYVANGALQSQQLEKIIDLSCPLSVSVVACQKLFKEIREKLQQIFGSGWGNLPPSVKKILFEMIYMFMKLESPALKDITQNQRKHLDYLAAALEGSGIQLTNELSQQLPSSPSVTRLMEESSQVSGALVMVLSLLGGKGYGLE